MEYLCNYIEANNLHFLIKELVQKNELGLLILTAIFSACITGVAYKMRKIFSQHDLIDTGITIFGHEPTILTPGISFILSIFIYFNVIEKIIENCNLNTEAGLLRILDNFFIYPSLFICLFLLLNPLVSLIFALCELIRKSNVFAIINLTVAIIQGITFYYSLPEYTNRQEYKQQIIEYENFQ